MKKQNLFLSLIVIGLIGVFGACAPLQATPTASLAGTSWLLLSYVNDAGEVKNVEPSSTVTAAFQNGAIMGNATCNQLSGTYTEAGNKLTLGPLAMTEMACLSDALMLQESQIIKRLSESATYEIANNQLLIKNAAGQTMLTYAVRKQTSLTETVWVATAINSGQNAVVSLIPGTEITATFGANNQITGLSGCNQYNASYQVTNRELRVGPVASTRKACAAPEGVMEQEIAYLNAIAKTATFSIDGSNLKLMDNSNATLVEFVAQNKTVN